MSDRTIAGTCAAFRADVLRAVKGPSGLLAVVGCECRDCTYARLPGVPVRGLAQTENEIGRELGISHTRVWQITQEALSKLNNQPGRFGSGR